MRREIELALRKQRLLFRSEALRGELAGHVGGIAPLLAVGDHVRDAAAWLRAHPKTAFLAVAGVVVLRPHFFLRWARRGLIAWQSWRRARAWLHGHVHSA